MRAARVLAEIGHSQCKAGQRTAQHQCCKSDRRGRNWGLNSGSSGCRPSIKGDPSNCCEGGAVAMTDQSHETPQDVRNLVRVVSACTLGLWAFAAGLLIGVFLFL